MGERWTDKRVMIHALARAVEYEYTYLDAIGGFDEEQERDTLQSIKRFRRVLKRLTGNEMTISEIYDDEVTGKAKMVSIQEITDTMTPITIKEES